MNYASLIAILAALSFSLPFLVNLATRAGIPRGYGITTTLAAAVFVLAWIFVRSRVRRRLAIEERITLINRQRAASPDSPDAFYLQGDHLGDLLLTLGRQREALDAFETHHQLAERIGEDTSRLEQTVQRLRRSINEGGNDASI